MARMHKTCSNCGIRYEKDPSFFTGAMYVSYAFSVAIVVSVFVAFNVLFEDPYVGAMSFGQYHSQYLEHH